MSYGKLNDFSTFLRLLYIPDGKVGFMSIEHGGFNIASWRNKHTRLHLGGHECIDCRTEYGVNRPASLGQIICNSHKEARRQKREEKQEVTVFEQKHVEPSGD